MDTRYENGIDAMQYTEEEVRQAEKSGAKRPRWESEIMGGKHPNPKACETCMFRATEFRGIKLDRADTANCQIYEDPENKPNEVYFEGAECEYYEKDE